MPRRFPLGWARRAARSLSRDVAAARERDPAARSLAEILLCYPGLHAIWMHRAAHALYLRGARLPARLVSEFSRFLTGIEIHPGARIGPGFFIDHGMGVVIGETTEIGEDVTLYQGVTLGGTGKETGKRHPTVRDGVIVGTGARVLGPVEIGESAKVGAGAIVIRDVPPNSTVVGNPGRTVVRDGQRVPRVRRPPDIDHTHLPDPIAEAIACLMRRVTELEQEVEGLRNGAEPVLAGERAVGGEPAPAGTPSQVGKTAEGNGDCIKNVQDEITAILGLNAGAGI